MQYWINFKCPLKQVVHLVDYNQHLNKQQTNLIYETSSLESVIRKARIWREGKCSSHSLCHKGYRTRRWDPLHFPWRRSRVASWWQRCKRSPPPCRSPGRRQCVGEGMRCAPEWALGWCRPKWCRPWVTASRSQWRCRWWSSRPAGRLPGPHPPSRQSFWPRPAPSNGGRWWSAPSPSRSSSS